MNKPETAERLVKEIFIPIFIFFFLLRNKTRKIKRILSVSRFHVIINSKWKKHLQAVCKLPRTAFFFFFFVR